MHRDSREGGSGGSGGATVRPATDQDDLDAIHEGHPMWMGAEQTRRTFAAAPPEDPVAMFVAEQDGRLVGYAHGIGAHLAAFGYGAVAVYVMKHARRRGIGRALYARALEPLRSSGMPGVMVGVLDDDEDGLAAALHCGLQEMGHHIESRLELAAVSEQAAAAALARITAAGIVLDELPADATATAWQQAYAFLLDRFSESPDAREGGGELPYPVFRSMIEEPWQLLLARRGGTLVGITAVMHRSGTPGRLNTLFTGVAPQARGLGVSTALKFEHARRVRARGWAEILTQNMDQNAPILAVNEKLGFRRISGARDLGAALEPAQPG